MELEGYALETAILGFIAGKTGKGRERLDVALSRSRKALIILGHQETLKMSTLWRKIFSYLNNLGVIRQNYYKSLSDVDLDDDQLTAAVQVHPNLASGMYFM